MPRRPNQRSPRLPPARTLAGREARISSSLSRSLGWIFAFAVCLSLGLQSLWQGNTGRTAALWAGCAALIALAAVPLIRTLRRNRSHSGDSAGEGSGPPPEP